MPFLFYGFYLKSYMLAPFFILTIDLLYLSVTALSCRQSKVKERAARLTFEGGVRVLCVFHKDMGLIDGCWCH